MQLGLELQLSGRRVDLAHAVAVPAKFWPTTTRHKLT